jgi:hypothetical protein
LEGFLYPEVDPRSLRLSKRALTVSSLTIERPSAEFRGALDRIELDRGIPRRASEWLEDRLVSVTEFVLGTPLLQRVDLDLDGRMETIRRFQPREVPPGGDSPGTDFGAEPLEYSRVLLSAESDWDGDGIYETGEEYYPDGRVARSWDMDRDGIKDYTVISPKE